MRTVLLAGAATCLLWAPAQVFARLSAQRLMQACGDGAEVRDVDSLVAAGRFWHASRAVAPLPEGARPRSAAQVLPHALIAEGMGRWERVDELLRRAQGGDSLPELLALGARADERAERYAAAQAKYRRLLALPATPAPLRSVAAVRLALTLERQGRGDSAATAWRRAAQAVPELADWFALHRAQFERDTVLAFAAVSGSRTPGAAQRADLLIARRRAAGGNLRGALEVYQRLARPLDIARIEFALGHRRAARQRADSILFADPTRAAALLAVSFLTQRWNTLSLREYLAMSRAYRARDDLDAAERAARRAGEDTVTPERLALALTEARGG